MKTLTRKMIEEMIGIYILMILLDLLLKKPVTWKTALISLAAAVIGVGLINVILWLWKRIFKK